MMVVMIVVILSVGVRVMLCDGSESSDGNKSRRLGFEFGSGSDHNGQQCVSQIKKLSPK